MGKKKTATHAHIHNILEGVTHFMCYDDIFPMTINGLFITRIMHF